MLNRTRSATYAGFWNGPKCPKSVYLHEVNRFHFLQLDRFPLVTPSTGLLAWGPLPLCRLADLQEIAKSGCQLQGTHCTITASHITKHIASLQGRCALFESAQGQLNRDAWRLCFGGHVCAVGSLGARGHCDRAAHCPQLCEGRQGNEPCVPEHPRLSLRCALQLHTAICNIQIVF